MTPLFSWSASRAARLVGVSRLCVQAVAACSRTASLPEMRQSTFKKFSLFGMACLDYTTSAVGERESTEASERTRLVVELVVKAIDDKVAIDPALLAALTARPYYTSFLMESGKKKAVHLRMKGSAYSLVLSSGPEIAEVNRAIYAQAMGVSREQVAVLPMTLAQALKITEKIPTVFAVDFSCELIGKDEPVFKNITAEKLKALLESANIKM